MTTDPKETGHFPVMLPEVLAALSPKAGETYIDATFGGGSYSRAFLEAADCNVIGIDRDPDAIKRGQEFETRYQNRFRIIESEFSKIDEFDLSPVDGIVFDIGVSSFQIDEADRGFSFNKDGPLDMRMGAYGPSAADVLMSLNERDLANIFWQFGEEKNSRQIARAIVTDREKVPFTNTLQLAELCARINRRNGSKEKINPATRVFQALRIFVNDELGELERALNASVKMLNSGGRLVVVTFHSLEDRIVKNFLNSSSGTEQVSRYIPQANEIGGNFTIISKKPILPSADEVEINPRSRSAKLRAAIRTENLKNSPQINHKLAPRDFDELKQFDA